MLIGVEVKMLFMMAKVSALLMMRVAVVVVIEVKDD
jgi:hypothetical protein